MDGKQQLIDMIVSTNREVIEGFDVVLDASSLVLSLPRADDIDGMNTVVMATAVHEKVENNQVFYYNRLTQEIFEAKLGNPTIFIPKEIKTPGQLTAYFAGTYNVDIDLAQTQSVVRNRFGWVVKFFTWSYIWAGTFIFDAEDDPLDPVITPLEDIITKTRLDGLYYPDPPL
jgi:hypothetical protein